MDRKPKPVRRLFFFALVDLDWPNARDMTRARRTRRRGERVRELAT
jgi:hypothetical protein